MGQTQGFNSTEDSLMIIIDKNFVSDNRCDIGTTQTIGFHTKWSHNNSDVVNGIIYVEDEYGAFKKLTSGKIFYDSFSASGGTKTDEDWTQGIYTLGRFFQGGIMVVENGMLRTEHVENKGSCPSAYPSKILVTDFLWEVRVKPMVLSGEGPEMSLIYYDFANKKILLSAVYDSYLSRSLRLMIAPGEHGTQHSTSKSIPFTMNTNTWYTMKMMVSGNNIKCYMNDKLILEANDPNLGLHAPGILMIAGYDYDEWGYWDDVKVCKSNRIIIKNLRPGQKVELYDVTGHLKVSGILGTIDTLLELDVSDLTFPFKGYFKVYSTDGVTLLYTTPLYDDIWGGDEYYASHRRELVTDETGWAYFGESLSTVGKKTWEVVGMDHNGVTFYNQTTPSPSIIWDRVNLQFGSEKQRVDVGTEAPIDVQGVYEYDTTLFQESVKGFAPLPFQGSVTFNDTLTKTKVGKYGYKIVNISDPLYGLSAFNSNEISIIFDRVNINLKADDSRIDIGQPLSYSWTGIYEYDGTRFGGSISLNETTTKEDIERSTITVSAILDQEYGLTSFDSNVISSIWDRIKILEGGVTEDNARIGDMETVWFKAIYEFDDDEFTDQDGVLYVNNVPMSWSSHDKRWKYSTTLDEPGSIVFEVTGVDNNKYGLSIINDTLGQLSIEWERPFWETPIGIMSIGALIVVLVSAVIFFLRKRI